MAQLQPSWRHAQRPEGRNKIEAEMLEAKRIYGLNVWQNKLIQLKSREAELRFIGEKETIRKSVSAMTNAQAIISQIDAIGYNWARGEYQRILDGDAEQREVIAQFRTGTPVIKPKHD
ncbi:unnamed protein product [marine sediment metagenome]|uniref:Uncharacterized protein n=2 Tax=marine sediment metagenome TaxID=412755 RepID=X1EAJ6_9ZZZZ